MSVKLHIKKGDMVYVNAGDSKGQQGKVLKVDAQKQTHSYRSQAECGR